MGCAGHRKSRPLHAASTHLYLLASLRSPKTRPNLRDSARRSSILAFASRQLKSSRSLAVGEVAFHRPQRQSSPSTLIAASFLGVHHEARSLPCPSSSYHPPSASSIYDHCIALQSRTLSLDLPVTIIRGGSSSFVPSTFC